VPLVNEEMQLTLEDSKEPSAEVMKLPPVFCPLSSMATQALEWIPLDGPVVGSQSRPRL